MNDRNDDELRSLWRKQPMVTKSMTPDELRQRALHAERRIRRSYVRHQVSFAIVALACATGLINLEGGLARVGCALLLAWALYGSYGLRRFGSPLSNQFNVAKETCADRFRRQLERQRDYTASWPWGISLAIPGFVLFVIGSALGPRQLSANGAIALTASFAFVCLTAVIFGKVLSGKWQREVEQLQTLINEKH